MKVGLLECDHVLDKYQHISGDYHNMFSALFPQWEFELFDAVNGHFPKNVEACEVYICSGSHFSVYDEADWILRLKAFTREIHQAGRYFLGICFGHQILAEALGGKVEKAKAGWCVGIHTFEVLQQESWMQPFQPTYNLLMMCQDQVVQLPENSQLLAQTADCPLAMFRIGNQMLSLQGHPEFSKAYDQQLMLDRVERMGAEKVQKGIASLERPLDSDLMAKWMLAFLESSNMKFP